MAINTKKLIIILLSFIIALSLVACAKETDDTSSGSSLRQSNKSKEKNGVPHKQLDADLYPEIVSWMECDITKYTHNVDTTLHQDSVTVEFSRQEKYLRTDYVQIFTYQYDRSTDLWNQISQGKRNFNYTLSANLVGKQWTGIFTSGLNQKKSHYSITVDAINTIDGWIKFSYDIDHYGTNYTGTEYLQYGEFTLTQVKNMFRISFNPNEGFSVSNN